MNREGVFTYGNRAMSEIIGGESVEGKTLTDVFRGDHLAVVREHLDSRFSRGVADEYEVEAVRPTDGVCIPIRCSAMPDINDQGEIVGTIAIVRDLLVDDVSSAVHKAVEDLRDGRAILQAVARQCERIVPFDIFGVNLFSADGEHSRTFYLYPESPFQLGVRWRQMSDYAKKLVETNQIINVPDLEEWLARPEWQRYREDPDTQQFLRMGLHSSLSFPVVSGSRVVATVGFARKRDKTPFTKLDEERLARLPLGAAVHMALHYQERDELKFALKLMSQIASGPGSTDFIAKTVIEEMAQHYEWENVSIFRPDEQEGQFWLVRQKAQKKSFLLPDDWHHPLDKGVTGRVYRTAKALNISDVTAPEFRDFYLAACPGSRSELCIPILVGGRVYWVLNLEASQRNAFAREEQETLENILREVAVVLELVSQTQIFTELLKHSQDSVIQTDFRGTIVQTNPATEALLGYSEEEMKGTTFATCFKDSDQARRVQEAKDVPNDEVPLVRKDGSEVTILLSGTSLPTEIGLKVYVCNDLSKRKRIETLEILRQMYNEIASQIKTPLSLAFTWLGKLRQAEIPPPAADLLDKTAKQLHKVDLTFERLLFYERHESIGPVERSLFEIPVLVSKIRQELPNSEASRIEVTAGTDVPPVSGDIFQIWFCLELLLAYLLRFVPEEGKVTVDISSRDGRVITIVRGRAPRVSGGTIAEYAETRWAIRAITEMALGERMIRSFIKRNHAGEFHRRRRHGDLMEYVLALPVA